jgi:hypothetical protein
MKVVSGIIATTVVLYVWGFIYWGVSQIPYSAWKQTANDEITQQVLKQTFTESGTYYVPGFNHDDEELARLYKAGPVGFVHINLEGRDQMDPAIMVGGFILNLAIVTLLAGFFRVAGAKEFRDFARLSLAAGAVAVVAIDVGDMIWWQTPVEWKMWQAIYDFSIWVIAGHLLGIFMKESKEAAD